MTPNVMHTADAEIHINDEIRLSPRPAHAGYLQCGDDQSQHGADGGCGTQSTVKAFCKVRYLTDALLCADRLVSVTPRTVLKKVAFE